MFDAEKYIRENAEIGYKEFKTHAYLKQAMLDLGYDVKEYDNVTGFTCVYDSGKAGPTLLIFAELDALLNSSHPDCDKQTGAVHSCGHNVQCATLLGVACALKAQNPDICGRVKFCFVPAEEGIDYSYRKGLIDKGAIKYVWGKPEYISRGIFDDCDLAFMVHTTPARDDGKLFYLNSGNNGNIIKQITLIGKASHAGGAPHLGINALNMASIAISTANSLRETFLDDDHVRFHSIVSECGTTVNTVPEKVIINSYVRAGSVEALQSANDKINNAFKCVAAAFGGNVIIEDRTGSMPLKNDAKMTKYACKTLDNVFGKDSYANTNEWASICTDFGDICTLMPAVHIYSCGMNGPLHGSNSNGGNLDISLTDSANFQLQFIKTLLSDGAKGAKDIIACHKPKFTKQEYLKNKNLISPSTDKKIEYLDDGQILIKK